MSLFDHPVTNTVEIERHSLVDTGQILAQRIFAISRLTPTMMLANIANALSVLLILWLEDQMRLDAVIWSMTIVGMASLFLMQQAARRHKPFPERLSPRTYRRSVMQAAFLGLLWAYPGLVILPDVDGPLQAFFIALSSGMIAGGAITLYPLPTAAYTFCGMIIVGSFIGFSRANEPSFWAFALVATTFSIIIYQSIKRHERIFVSEFEARKILDGQNERMSEMLEAARNDALEERKRSEERLLQAQKLEAIGQLTAGIAHDFNNLLAAIRGHAELLALSDSAQHDLIDPIVQSSDRGAELVRRLLAFSRQQTLAPRAVYPRAIINETSELMQRTLREDIAINMDIAPDAWAILIDPNRLTNAILNLGTNARDAMPNGGVITISLTNAKSAELPSHLIGDFVRLCVRDTGTGMNKETQRRAIEPFFTTKEFGMGSGLGLSMVYGFAMQSGGAMSIHSRPGVGTTITLLLPKSPISPQVECDDTPKNVPAGNGKRVLLIEDNPPVRDSMIKLLESLDYVVTAKESVEDAKDVMLQTAEDPDIILSDIVLPGGRHGTDFIREVRDKRPKIAVVLMTGYFKTEAEPAGDPVKGVFLLNKPFGRAELAVAMSEAFRKGSHGQSYHEG